MKPSRYNIHFKLNNQWIIFNTRTLNFFKIADESDLLKYKPLLKPEVSDFDELSVEYDVLCKNGFIVSEDLNEHDETIRILEERRGIPHYTLMILPTYDCNLHCWYCVQEHTSMTMDREHIERIKRHISKYLIENQIKSFEIHWFGGEPLLCLESHIREISDYAINFCKRHGIIFFNNITTNGVLITPNVVKEMKRLRFKMFQITLDGARHIHNETRYTSIGGTFDIIVQNIRLLAEEILDAYIFLRYNFTEKNYSSINDLISQLNQILPYSLRSRISVSPIKVWQEERDKFPSDCFYQIYSQFKANGYKLTNVEMSHDFSKCIADMKHSTVIFPNGKCDKCNNIKPSEARFYINNTGEVELLPETLMIPAKALEQANCMSCSLFPSCLGPCLEFQAHSLKTNGCIICMDKDANISVLERIKNFCTLKLMEEKDEAI